MFESFHHFAHLFWRVFVCSYTFLGTTPGGLGAQIVSIVGTEVRGGWWNLSAWKENWRGGLKRVIGALLFVWAITFVVCAVTTLYDDHRNMAGRWKHVVNEKDNLKVELQKRDDYIHTLESRSCPKCPNGVRASTKGITPGTPPEPQPHECRVSEIMAEPNPNVKGAMSETIVVIHCNYRIDAPLCARVEFTQDFVQGNIFLPDEGTVMGGGWKKQGKVYQGCLQSPSLPANHILTVTVQGATKEFPRVVGGTVFSQ
jgi:hypothetical protein